MEKESEDINKLKAELHKNAQDARFLHALFQASPDAFLFIDKQGNIQFFNEKASKSALYFFQKQVSKGDSVYDFLSDIDMPDIEKHFNNAVEGQCIEVIKSVGVNDDKHELLLNFQPVSDSKVVSGVFLTVRDVTTKRQSAYVHQQAEQALIESDQRYKMLVENAFDAIYLIKNYQFQYVNKRYEELSGYSSAEILSPDFDISASITAKSKAIMDQRFEARKRGEELPSQYEFQIRQKNGRIIDVEISTASISNDDGDVLVLGIMRDISDRMEARAAVEREKAYFKHLFESLPFGVVVLSEADVVLDCNTAFLNMFKLEKPSVTGCKINDLIVPGFLKDEGNSLTTDVASGRVIAQETVRSVSNGQLVNVSISGRPIIMPDGSRIVFGTYQDITDRKRTEQALFQERDLMNALMDNIPDTIYFKDTDSNFTRINKAQQKTLGIKDQKEAIGKSDFDFFDLEHAQQSFEEERDVMSRDKPMINKVEKINTSKGWQWFSATKVPLKNSAGNIVGLAGISRDITELKQLEEVLKINQKHLKDLNAEKDKLFSIIAHDLRSPFNSFIMLTDMFMDDQYELTVSEMRKMAASMHKSASNVSDLLDNLLDWSRLQRGLFDLEKAEIALWPIVNTAIDGLSELISSKQLQVVNKVEEDFQVWADRSMLSSMMRNLLSNAVKFTPKRGEIFIDAGDEDKQYSFLNIRDTGIGMPENIRKNLFIIDGKTGRKGTEGEATAGLGLILVKEFVEKHQGHIEVKSIENEGSSFKIFLPKTENQTR
ncbi:MAG: PAS domain S-box protein [Bacteroidetes bacterium]|nr:PAS domain S-box protein [Bacteroidota bacterium]